MFPKTDMSYVTIAQEEREYAIKAFKSGKKDVMVASSVASKVQLYSSRFIACALFVYALNMVQGLDFAEIQHVINYSMPKDVEGEISMDLFPTLIRAN
jgi:ATP-dependent RNA helicase DDX41